MSGSDRQLWPYPMVISLMSGEYGYRYVCLLDPSGSLWIIIVGIVVNVGAFSQYSCRVLVIYLFLFHLHISMDESIVRF